jgi:hypothetical protein
MNDDELNAEFDKLYAIHIKDREAINIRNATLEEVAQEFESMRIAFGDTAHSFAQYVRDMKKEQFKNAKT